MKAIALPFRVAFLFFAVAVTSTANDISATRPTNDNAADFDSGNWHFRPGIGLIYGKPDTYAEGIGKALLDWNASGRPEQAIHDVPIGDFRLDDADEFRMAFRLQDTIDFTSAGAGPATFTWSNEDGNEDWNARGAVLVDLYFAKSSLLGYDTERKSFRLSLAAEVNKFEENGKETDNQSFGALLDYFPHLQSNQKDRYWHQPIRLGAVYRQDNITGTEDWGFLVRYDPVFRIFQKFLIGARNRYQDSGIAGDLLGGNIELAKPEASKSGDRSTRSGRAERFTDSNVATKSGFGFSDPTNPINNPSSAIDIRPFLGLKLADGSDVSSLNELSDAYFQYGAKASLSLYHGRVEMGYMVIAHTPVSDGGDTFINQTAFIDISPRARSSKSPLFLRMAYHTGEAAPLFEHHEGWTLGFGLRL